MKILSIRPAPPGAGNARARFDIELEGGLRLYHLKLAETPSGWRVFAPSAFGEAVATFTHELTADLVSAARIALGEITRNDSNSRAA